MLHLSKISKHISKYYKYIFALKGHWIEPVSLIHQSREVFKNETDDTDSPIKYSASKAHDYSSLDTFAPIEKEYPWYQTVSITFSMFVFMVYFFVLREESDWDENMKTSIYERIPGLKEQDKRLGVMHSETIDYVKKYRRDRSEVSSVIKYLVFGFNVIFWILGGLMLAIGLWAWAEKDMFANLGKLSQIPLDPALMLIISGSLIYIIGFTGCIGALRENTFLLLIYCVSVGIIFFCELAFGIIIFVYKDWVKEQVKLQLKLMIVQYRDDPDLQNLIDWVQEEWLRCCGVESFSDWDMNIYFNCSSPSREACGVPFSCCKPNPNDSIKNWQCGYDTRKRRDSSDLIYTVGCIEQGESWVNHNLIPVAAVFVGLALVQILGICFAQNLRSDIFAQKARWQEH